VSPSKGLKVLRRDTSAASSLTGMSSKSRLNLYTMQTLFNAALVFVLYSSWGMPSFRSSKAYSLKCQTLGVTGHSRGFNQEKLTIPSRYPEVRVTPALENPQQKSCLGKPPSVDVIKSHCRKSERLITGGNDIPALTLPPESE